MSNEERFLIPERVAGSMTGSQFLSSIAEMGMTSGRELAILQQFELGNIPDFLRTPYELSIGDSGHFIRIFVLRDYLSIGTDEDFCRIPMNAYTAQKVADMFDACLPTKTVVDEVWRMADRRLTPIGMGGDPGMIHPARFLEHNRRIELQRSGFVGLLAGHKKDIVIGKGLAEHPGNIGIYGWHDQSGALTGGKKNAPIQGRNFRSHVATYVDYSHGVRLVSRQCLVDNVEKDIVDVLASPELASLLSDEGPLSLTRYPVL